MRPRESGEGGGGCLPKVEYSSGYASAEVSSILAGCGHTTNSGQEDLRFPGSMKREGA